MTAEVMFATGLLRTFTDAGVFEAADVHVAQRLTALTGESDERVALAVALVVRALRGGSVCVDLRAAPGLLGDADLPWPGADDWLAAVRASALLGPPPVLRFFGDLLYFDRYWLEEEQVCTDLLALSAPPVGIESSSYERLFEPGYEEQRAAAEIAVSHAVTVLTGGPGTGKTTTIARLLALLLEHAERAGMPPPRIALAAPTGKAAARLAEAVAAGPDGSARPTGRGWPACPGPRCTGCWVPGRIRRCGSSTIAPTGCRTTSSWWTRRRWCR
ncbi:uvrD/REP helicase N-terminal domain protein [Mycobacterium intracellulare 1956]|uniref:UvrD/REP helicase N-terminal domain protein n=1 Tax=Mycobacterium intracellulare 1956 TaxID=1299331 RepID=X8CA65_MYCIT|nr:uvrD/REP helicase N-terminal domain protein [Mycobacterium intracellulare]EUA53232.1 uvrD/REP helicase N-terminal domain protein [Mycobacterium intracellulare 1956]